MMSPPPEVDRDRGAEAILDALTSTRNLLDGVIPDQLAPTPDATSFVLGSCQYPGGFMDNPVAYASYRRLRRRLNEENPPRFIVLAGDQVYVDATAGLFDPTNSDDRYNLPYHRWLRSPSVRNVLRTLRSFMLLDDHEIQDNWEPPAPDPDPDPDDYLNNGIRSYMQYQRNKAAVPAERYFDFTFDDFSFFMLDTRTNREARGVSDIGTAKIIDDSDVEDQRIALEKWLDDNVGAKPKFIVSPSMILPRHRRAVRWNNALSALQSDGWDGYPKSLFDVLGFIAFKGYENVYFLSGDEHRSYRATIDITNGDTGVVTRCISIHSSASYAPFPFANSLPEDVVEGEQIEFSRYSIDFVCDVTTEFPPGRDGFTSIIVEDQAGTWTVESHVI